MNCLSSSILAFDDTHLATVTHPTGPVAAALFAFAEKQTVPGEDFVNALALGMEIECRMSNVLLAAPAVSSVGRYITGLTGPIGAAAALGNLLRLDEQRITWAIGLAATQASGFREPTFYDYAAASNRCQTSAGASPPFLTADGTAALFATRPRSSPLPQSQWRRTYLQRATG